MHFNSKNADLKAVSIPNDLYGNETMSAFKPAKSFTKPVASALQEFIVSVNVCEAKEKMQALLKFALIIRSKKIQELPISGGDIVEVFQKNEHEKRGK